MTEFQKIVETLQNAIVIIYRGKIVFCNKSFIKLVNQSFEEIIGKKFFDYIYTSGKSKYSKFKKALPNFDNTNQQFFVKFKSPQSLKPIDVKVAISSINYCNKQSKLIEIFDDSVQVEKLLIQKTINDIEAAVYSSRNSIELFVQIHNIINSIIGAKNFYVAFYDIVNNVFTYPYFVDEKNEMPIISKAKKSLNDYLIKSGEPQLINSEKYAQLESENIVKKIKNKNFVWLGVPLKVNNEIIGAIVLQDYDNPLAYGEKEKQLLSKIVPTISDAILKLHDSKALEESEKEYKAIFEYAHDAILIFDSREEVIIDANYKACEMYRVSKSSLIGESLKKYSKKLGFVNTGFEEAIKNGVIRNYETVHYDSDGNKINVEVNGVVINFHKQKAIVSIIRDITDRRNAESKIQKYIEELELTQANLEKNTKDLTLLNEKIRASEDELVESNKQKDKFFSIIAHDLRSPFNSLLGFTQYLSQELDTLNKEEIREFVQNIDKSGRNVYNLLENLLQWSKVTSGRFNFAPSQINIKELFADLVHLYSANAFRKKINLFETVDSSLTVTVDQNLLRTVLRNLVSNAIKFTNAEGEIKISAKKLTKKIEFAVKDTGVGITKCDIKNLFELETRISTVGTDYEIGSGLGLILCKEFVEKMGGELKVQSKRGKGTTFSFKIPM